MPRLALFLAAGIFAAGLAPLAPLHAQGSLTPGAGPAPSLRTLTQLEPRTPIQSLPASASGLYSITQSGSYYLTDSIHGLTGRAGIAIAVGLEVSIDLRGFALEGDGVGGNAISATTGSLSVCNGSIRNWTGAGITTTGGRGHLQDVRISDCAGGGINVGSHYIITRCTAYNCGTGTGSPGIRTLNNGRIVDCVANSTKSGGHGISVDYASFVTGTLANENTGHGILGAGSFVQVDHCQCTGNTLDGFRATGSQSGATDCQALGNALVGIRFQGNGGRIDRCHANNNFQIGISVETANGNVVVVRNTAVSNVTNYSIAAGNRSALIVTWSAANGFTSADPMANGQ